MYYAIGDKLVVKVPEEAEAILAEVGAHIYRCTRYEPPAVPASRSRPGRASSRRRP